VEEHRFWLHVAASAKRHGWRLVEIAARALPYTKDALTTCVPARLWEFDRKLRNFPLPDSDKECQWVGNDFFKIMEDWEHRRWELKERNPDVARGLRRLAGFSDRTISLINPSVVLTTNKIDHPCALFRMAAIHYGIPTFIVERSPLDTIWLEPDGLFAESRIWKDYRNQQNSLSKDVIKHGKKIIRYLARNPYGMRKAGRSKDSSYRRLFDSQKHIFFLPMDNVLWTGWEQKNHPQRMIDNPLYDSPLEAIKDLAEKIQSLGGILVVKNHPACLHIKDEILPETVHFYDGDIRDMIKLSDVVVVFNTKVAYPALAIGKPVVTLAPNPVAASGATYHCLKRHGVHETLRLALNRNGLSERLHGFVPFVGWLANHIFYSWRKRDALSPMGPNRFVEFLLDNVNDPGQWMGDDELLTAVEELRRIAAYKPQTAFNNIERTFYRSVTKIKNLIGH
jgi:hypothetical protein